jgi:hypothetical protein
MDKIFRTILSKLFLLIIFMYSVGSNAADPNELEFKEIRSGGVKQGCNLVFKVLSEDAIYGQAKNILVYGGFTLYSYDTTMAWGFKIGVVDLSSSIEAINAGKLVISDEINYGYFEGDGFSSVGTELAKDVNKEGPNTSFFVYSGDNNAFLKMYAMLMTGLDNSELRENIDLYFNRRERGMDVKVSFNPFSDANNVGAISDYINCIKELLELDKV